MARYVGDESRMIVHRIKDLRDACLEPALDITRVTNIRSREFLDYLTRSEHWHECPHCFAAHAPGAHEAPTTDVAGGLDPSAIGPPGTVSGPGNLPDSGPGDLPL